MSQPELLKKVIRVLNEKFISFMLTGSIVSSIQGEPRATHDIDIIIAIQKPNIFELTKAFTMPDYYLDEDNILDAIKNQAMFNLLDAFEGDKVDFWVLTNDDFDKSRFQRRIKKELFGEIAYISSPEDTILAKLKWAKLSGGSEKQFIDALRVYEVQYRNLDLDYLEKWVQKLDLVILWDKLKEEGNIV